ncbi:MAG: hypothetical protein ACLP8A_18225 [Methylovirgula sp.]
MSDSHLYRVGEMVLLDMRAGHALKADASFTVLARLPPLGNEFQYRIKSIGEPYERVVLEHHLTRAVSREATADSFFKKSDAHTS